MLWFYLVLLWISGLITGFSICAQASRADVPTTTDRWFAITGRIPFDDEDEVFIVQASDASSAGEAFIKHMLASRDDDRVDPEAGVIINAVIDCGTTEPTCN